MITMIIMVETTKILPSQSLLFVKGDKRNGDGGHFCVLSDEKTRRESNVSR